MAAPHRFYEKGFCKKGKRAWRKLQSAMAAPQGFIDCLWQEKVLY